MLQIINFLNFHHKQKSKATKPETEVQITAIKKDINVNNLLRMIFITTVHWSVYIYIYIDIYLYIFIFIYKNLIIIYLESKYNIVLV